MSALGNPDWGRVRERILRVLSLGPQKSDAIAFALARTYPRAVVFKCLQFLMEEHRIVRESNRKPWRVV